MNRPKSARLDSNSETVADLQGTPSPLHFQLTNAAGLVFEPGKVLAERYEILRLIGHGGMGAVYEAQDRELDRKVAIKIIRPELAADPEIIRRFKHELLTATQVSHRNVVRIYDIGEAEGTKFISMEFLDGKDLATLIHERGALPALESAEIVRQICSGLGAAHSEGIVHRDLKPANIMINKSGRVHVTDFGIARSHASGGMTQTGVMIGTLEYMSPEQAKGAPADVRSDLYAVGLIFYELLTGALAFTSDTPLGSLYQRTQGPPPDPKTHNVVVPDELRSILFRLLETNPQKRFQAAADVVKDLEGWESGVGAKPGRVPITISIPRISISRKWGAAALALLVIVLSLAAAYYSRTRVPRPGSGQPVKLVLADFKNDTGDPVFAGTLEPTMSVALEGAPFISIFNRSQARKNAQQLRPGSTELTEELTRLVASREGVQVVLSGRIATAGQGYVLSVRALDAVTGKLIAEQQTQVGGKDEVLRATAELAAYVRNQLGDATPPSLQMTAAETFTAASLESAHEYAQAQELQLAGKSTEAIGHYKKSVELDPNLGRGYAGLAVAYFNLKQRAGAEENYRKAMALLDHMSERERYRTLGAYYLTYANNYPKAIETYKKLVELYPSDSAGHNNLSIAYVYTLQMSQAVESVKKALAINPGNLQHRLNLALYSMYDADFDTATAETQKVLSQNPQYEFAYLPLAISSLAKGDESSARAAYTKLAKLGDQGRSMAATGIADLAMFRGDPSEAIEVLTPAIAQDSKGKLAGEMAQKYVLLAEAYAAEGKNLQARDAALRAIRADNTESVAVPAALVLAQTGDLRAALQESDRLAAMLPDQSRAYGLLIKGAVQLKQRNHSGAISSLEQSLKLRDSWLAHFWLAQTYIEAGHYAEALPELEICEKRRGETTDLFFADTTTIRHLPALYSWKARAQEGLGLTAAAAETRNYYSSLRPSGSTPRQ
jgi:tetratricopeptide (TPR) repeat protein/predicted Ser/Thr protein kinase